MEKCNCTLATDCDLESECVTMSHLQRFKKKSRSVTRLRKRLQQLETEVVQQRPVIEHQQDQLVYQ